jgi:hypothetical protein
MLKGLLWLVIAIIVIAAIYYTVLGLIKMVRAFIREDDLDEAAELRAEREALQAENDRFEDMLQRKRADAAKRNRRSGTEDWTE